MEITARPSVRLDTSLESLLEHAPAGTAARVLATLVATAGSTYRKPGARMLIMADGSYLGLLSGGCFEADLAIHAREVLDSGIPRAVEYDMRGPDDVLFGVGAGCAGALRVLLEPAGPGSLAAESLPKAGQAAGSGRATSLIAVHESTELALGTYDLASLPSKLSGAAHRALADSSSREVIVETSGGCTRAFVQFLAPIPTVLICGAGSDAQPVAAAAIALGWRVAVVDHRPAYALASRFPGADVRCSPAVELSSVIELDRCHAAVVMSHHLPSDISYLRTLAATVALGYVGLLGPPARRQRIFEELGTPVAQTLRHRVRGPVGIDIGAVTPPGIALSIVSQIHEWLAGSDAAPVAHPGETTG